MNPFFLKFKKKMRKDLSYESCNDFLLPYLNSLKSTEALINHDGEIKGRELCFIYDNGSVLGTFEHGSCLHFHSNSWVFRLSPSQSNFMSHVTPLSLFKECNVQCHIISRFPPRKVNAAKSLFVPPNFQRRVVLRITLYSQNYLLCCVSYL